MRELPDCRGAVQFIRMDSGIDCTNWILRGAEGMSAKKQHYSKHKPTLRLNLKKLEKIIWHS